MTAVNPWGKSSEWRDGIPPEIHPGDAEVLGLLFDQVKRPGMVVVEVGSWVGNGSTRVLAELVRSVGGTLYCVDTWAGSENVGHHQAYRAQYGSMFGVFAENVRRYGGQDVVRPLAMPSTEACELFADESVDLVFIDANHGYSHVKRDTLAWLQKVRYGGIVSGHDCEVCYMDLDARLRHAIETRCEEDYYDNQQFPGPPAFHAGVVKAVQEVFGGRATLWSRVKPSTVWSFRFSGLRRRIRSLVRRCQAAWRGDERRDLPAPTPWPIAPTEAARQSLAVAGSPGG